MTVDGVAGTALSVMSQGELHALGLALFLPRASAPESPFRFILGKILAAVASAREVEELKAAAHRDVRKLARDLVEVAVTL